MPPPDFRFAPLVPELLVSDLAASLRFYCDLCGFAVAYARPEEGFACLQRGGAQLMLEDVSVPGRKWITGPMERPFGRGLNFEISVEDVAALHETIKQADWPIYLALETKSYRASDASVTQSQFAVQDPDGYLLRFSQSISQG
jgi:catechol 2,3-dioxygenase-like lactoylglutathione lyase family enzyme